jgi:hypothetical protein
MLGWREDGFGGGAEVAGWGPADALEESRVEPRAKPLILLKASARVMPLSLAMDFLLIA